MAWLDDNGDDGEFSRIDEEPSGDGEDLSDEEEAQEEEVVVTERPGLAMPPPSSPVKPGKRKAQTRTRSKSKARSAARGKKKPAKKARAKKVVSKRPVRRKKR
jgi:hypothetical protein